MQTTEQKRVSGLAATKAWQERNPDRVKASSKQRLDERIAAIGEIKLQRGCEEPTCVGYPNHPAALDFDHVRGEKLYNVAKMAAGYSWAKILVEIEKCDVVCANCHRIRTHVTRES
jgi:hypothetical protein